jgi:putative flippase GtrA
MEDKNIKIKFLAAGFVNTTFGYLIGLFAYEMLNTKVHIVLISLLANFFAISFSFLNYKLFVFKTKDYWIKEYLKSFVVYGGVVILGTILIWILVDFLRIQFWISQIIVILIISIISFIGHRFFTFSNFDKRKITK